jgi:hypothetical protein
MFYVLQNESTAARRRCPILLTDSATGTTGQSGIALTNIYPYVSINGGAFAGGAGTVAEVNFGQYYYEFAPAEITTLGLAGIHITAAGCRDYDAIVQIAAFNLYSASTGTTAGDVWSYADRKITGGIADTVTTLTNRSGFAITGGTITTVSDKTGYSLSASQAFDLAGNITGNLSGSVGSVSGAVGSVTSAVDVSTTSMSGIANTVWSTDISGYTSPSAGYELSNVSAGSGASAYDVWNFVLSNSDTAEVNLVAASAGGGITAGAVADAVWTAQVATYATAGTNETLGTDTYGQKIARTVNINRPISINTANSVVVGSMANGAITATAIASNAITEAKFATDALTSRVIAADAITSAELAPSANSEIADAVWAYATRNITGGTITTVSDKTGYSLSSTQTFDVTGNITGNVSGSVGSVSTVSAGAISASSFLSGAIDAAALANDAVTEIATGVWSVATRTITGGTITTVSDKTGYSLSGTQAFNLTGNITGNLSGSVGSVTGSVGGNVTGSVGSVSGNVGGNVVGSVGSVSSNVTLSTGTQSSIANSVWSTDISGYTSPSAGYSLSVAGSGGVSAADVWSYNGGRTITGGTVGSVTNDVTVSTTSMTGIAGTVWNYATRTLTSATGISAYDVWNFDPTAMTSPQAGAILTDIQTDTNTIITDIGNVPNNVWASDISGYSTPGEAGYELSQASSGAGLTSGDIWSYATRTITGGIADTVTTLTNKSGFAITGGTIDVVNDKTGYSLSGTQTFNVTGNITGNVSGSVGSVTNPVTFSSGQYAAIASSVWNAGTRTLTSGSGISAYEVWNFNTRTLTSGAGITISGSTNIVNGPYFVKSNVDGQDGTLDVIRGMVQDIQLTVTDAFQNPFDTTALGLAVNFYDQAGTLVTSYGTTELYGPAGLVQFTLDTVVTNTEGRYNLILSAAGAGNTIKFGPLQTLVRPF